MFRPVDHEEIGSQVTLAPLDAANPPGATWPARRIGSPQHPQWRPEARIHIEEVYPELDGGRYPVKRIVGEVVRSLGRPVPRRA